MEECYPGNVSREVSECLIEAAGDGYGGLDGWDADRCSAAIVNTECNASETQAYAAALAEANNETADCWDECADGDECAEYFRTSAICTSEFYSCWATAMARYRCDYTNDSYSDAVSRCSDNLSTCNQALPSSGVGCTF